MVELPHIYVNIYGLRWVIMVTRQWFTLMGASIHASPTRFIHDKLYIFICILFNGGRDCATTE